MSSSYSCEMELRKLAEELKAKGYELEEAAEVLKTLREKPDLENKIKEAKDWAKSWLKGGSNG